MIKTTKTDPHIIRCVDAQLLYHKRSGAVFIHNPLFNRMICIFGGIPFVRDGIHYNGGIVGIEYNAESPDLVLWDGSIIIEGITE